MDDTLTGLSTGIFDRPAKASSGGRESADSADYAA